MSDRAGQSQVVLAWATNPYCRDGGRCSVCRSDDERGAAFRAHLARQYEMPAGWPECPHGFAWGHEGDQPPVALRRLPLAQLTDEEIEQERRRLSAGGCCAPPAGTVQRGDSQGL